MSKNLKEVTRVTMYRSTAKRARKRALDADQRVTDYLDDLIK